MRFFEDAKVRYSAYIYNKWNNIFEFDNISYWED